MHSKEQRLAAAIAGEVLDRPPIALWRHFPVDDQYPQELAASCLAFQREYDFDFIKVTPASSYCLKDWGVRDEWTGNPEGTRDYTDRVVMGPEDWRALPKLDPWRGHLGEQLETLRLVGEGVEERTPFVATIFSPLAQAKNLAGSDRLLSHLNSASEDLLTGLETLCETSVAWIEAAKSTGLAGIFYAVQHANSQLMDWPSYQRFGLKFDHRIMEAASGLWLNILHLHGEPLLFELADELQPPVVNWHDRETQPDLTAGAKRVEGAVCGGLQRWESLVLGTPERVRDEACDAIEALDGRGLILGTGCVLPITAPRSNILACRSAVDCA